VLKSHRAERFLTADAGDARAAAADGAALVGDSGAAAIAGVQVAPGTERGVFFKNSG
jgi:hypothetical protein